MIRIYQENKLCSLWLAGCCSILGPEHALKGAGTPFFGNDTWSSGFHWSLTDLLLSFQWLLFWLLQLPLV